MTEIRWTTAAYDSIVEILGARTGLAFRADQRASTQDGIEYAMRRAGTTDPEEFARLLGYDVEALEDLIVKLTVGETYFFREEHHFHGLRHRILPDILQNRGSEHRIRIWSVACASGEEPYSIAMTCEQAGLSRQCEILATDISSEALGKARAGVYRNWSLRGDGLQHAKPYLQPLSSGEFQVQEKIKKLVRFEFLNLALDAYPSAVTGTRNVDVIFCRNVLIYFSKQTVGVVVSRLTQCLAQGGWIITASSDPPLSDYAQLEPVVSDFGVFYQHATDKSPTPAPSVVPSNRLPTPIAAGPQSRDVQPKARRNDLDPASPPADSLEFATRALERGDYASAVSLTQDLLADSAACSVHLKALANIDTMRAIARCESLTTEHPLAAELHYLQAVLLMEQNLDVEAIQAAQRAVFVDRSLAMAHFLLGSILRKRGSLESALRSFRTALQLSENCSPDQVIPLSEDELASDFARAAKQQVQAIEQVIGRFR